MDWHSSFILRLQKEHLKLFVILWRLEKLKKIYLANMIILYKSLVVIYMEYVAPVEDETTCNDTKKGLKHFDPATYIQDVQT